ncbi:hypothetical protein AA0111_g12367 [Alternaria arborescens]|uniref:hypothetical protein n=1 Tax=Alternaria arborescens TaxID=156630 RepID=UPI0010751EAE|nr:hypothetical protein AA0111_g12367 [Alternaria arborescens]RYO13120.1 hypothetical protein AA0111_g12367 [Alternaria arborescens]
MAPKDVRPSTRFLNGPNLPEPQGYSDAASVNGAKRTIYTSGQLGQHSDGSFTSAFGEQALPATRNLLDVVRAAGASAKDFVKLTFYIVDWNENMHEELFAALSLLAISDGGTPMQPTTTLIPVPRLAFSEAKLEIEAVVCVGGLAQIWTVEEDSTSQPSDAKEIDVVVIGGGFSGCMAAYDVHQAGHSVMLFEAKHRIGGQSSTQKLRSGPGLVELGATWINKVTQPTVYELTRRFGLDCKDQYLQGDVIWKLHDGSFVRASTNLPEIRDPEMAETLGKLMGTFALAAEETDIHNLGSFPKEEDVSVSDRLTTKGLYNDALLQGLARFLTTAWVGREPYECGIYYILDYVRSAGGLASINTDGPGGAQGLKIKQGTSAIATALAGAIEPGSVQINAPVDSITQYGNVCQVTTSNGTRYRAKKVILAIPTNTYTNIRFSPPLPHSKRALVMRTKPGIYATVILSYTPSWCKDAGLQGKSMSMKGPICFSWDISDDATKQYSLALFVAGDTATAWHRLSELSREVALIDHLVSFVGPELADKARDVLDVDAVE